MEGGGDVRTDIHMDSGLEIHPCVQQDIGPLELLPKKLEISKNTPIVRKVVWYMVSQKTKNKTSLEKKKQKKKHEKQIYKLAETHPECTKRSSAWSANQTLGPTKLQISRNTP